MKGLYHSLLATLIIIFGVLIFLLLLNGVVFKEFSTLNVHKCIILNTTISCELYDQVINTAFFLVVFGIIYFLYSLSMIKDKKAKIKIIISFVIILVLVLLTGIFYPILIETVQHPGCILSGGRWEGFQNSCADECGDFTERFHRGECEVRPAYSCNCDSEKCWNGKWCDIIELWN